MINTLSSDLTEKKGKCKSILCSRCLSHEVNSWINENWKSLDEETKNQILQELKAIKLRKGKCIVCNSDLVSDGTSEEILKILEQNKVDEKLKRQFKKFFCIGS